MGQRFEFSMMEWGELGCAKETEKDFMEWALRQQYFFPPFLNMFKFD